MRCRRPCLAPLLLGHVRGLIATAFREHREILFKDASFALRLMRKEIWFTIAVIAILGMAIGASTASFLAAMPS